MELNSHVEYCRQRLESLRYQTPKLARVLASADEILKSQPGVFDGIATGTGRPIDTIRTAMLENSLRHLKEARDLFKPLADSASIMVERIDSISARVNSTREKMSAFQPMDAIDDIKRLSAQISLTEKRLFALNRLMDHINPSLNSIDYGSVGSDNQLSEEGVARIERVLETAESLIASKKFCDSLNELEYLKGSAVLLEASQRITANLDKVCELLFLRLQRASRTLSHVLCKAFDEASVIALKHSSSFVPPSGKNLTDAFGMSSIFDADAEPGASVSLRVLKLLQMRPTYLYHFVNGMRDILGQISVKHFATYTSCCAVNPYNRSAAVKNVLGHLRHNVSYIRNCVVGLYSNAGLPFFYTESSEHGATLLKASDYISSILELLVNPLEAKLNKVMATDATRGVEGVMACNVVVDLFIAILYIGTYIKEIEELVSMPWMSTGSQLEISLDDPEPECETDVEEGNEESVSSRSAMEEKEVTIVLKLKSLHEEWRRRLFSYVEDCIEVPLANEPACNIDAVAVVDIAAPQIIHTVCEFIQDIINVQSRYDEPSQDLQMILERTINAAIIWCHRSAACYNDYGSVYLINCLAKIQKALESDVPPRFFKERLQMQLETQVTTTVYLMDGELKELLDLGTADGNSENAERKMKKISAIVFGDSIMECSVPTVKRLALVEDRYQKVIKSRVYALLAEHYTSLSEDKNSAQVQQIKEFTAQL